MGNPLLNYLSVFTGRRTPLDNPVPSRCFRLPAASLTVALRCPQTQQDAGFGVDDVEDGEDWVLRLASAMRTGDSKALEVRPDRNRL